MGFSLPVCTLTACYNILASNDLNQTGDIAFQYDISAQLKLLHAPKSHMSSFVFGYHLSTCKQHKYPGFSIIRL